MLKSGDLLIFSGTNKTSNFIKFFTGSQYTHVGIVYQCPKNGKLYLWESGHVPKNVDHVIKKKGCGNRDAKLTPLESRLRHYKGKIFVRRLLCKKKIDMKYFVKFIATHIGKTYSPDFVTSWNGRGAFSVSLIPLPFLDVSSDGSSWICSQLVAATYEHLGILDLTYEGSESAYHIMPSDYAEGSLPTTKDYEFLPLEVIK